MAPLRGPGPGAGGGEREPAGGGASGKWPSRVARPSPAAARGASSLLRSCGPFIFAAMSRVAELFHKCRGESRSTQGLSRGQASGLPGLAPPGPGPAESGHCRCGPTAGVPQPSQGPPTGNPGPEPSYHNCIWKKGTLWVEWFLNWRC